MQFIVTRKLWSNAPVIADKRVLVTAPLSEVEKFDHPWVQEYFHGPRGRAAARP